MSRWILHIKEWAKKHNKSFGCALSDKRCSESYHKGKDIKSLPAKKIDYEPLENVYPSDEITRKTFLIKRPPPVEKEKAPEPLVEKVVPQKGASKEKAYRVTIDDNDYIIQGDKIARHQSGIVIKDKKLVERLFKKLSAQRIAIANNEPIPEKKTRKPSKAQEEKKSAEAYKSYMRMKEDKMQGGLY
jgi:hypothetical protein